MPATTNSSNTMGHVFPREHPFASLIASLVSIRSDLRFEFRMLTSDEAVQGAGARDLNEAFYTRCYFFKGTLRALYSVERILPNLTGRTEFRTLMAPQQVRFDELRAALTTTSREFVRLRNTIGAHTEDLTEARNTIDDVQPLAAADGDEFSPIWVTNVLNLAALFGPAETRDALMVSARERMRRLSDTSKACLTLLDLVIDTYLAAVH